MVTAPLDIDEWRGHDLRGRKRKIRKAIALEPVNTPEDVPLIINTPCYFAFADENRPVDYFRNPAVMVRFQEKAFEDHLSHVHDDTVPYFMPWYGTGVLSSSFGCRVSWPERPDADPAVIEPIITSPKDAARLKPPKPEKDGLMPRVLDTIDYANEHTDLPVGLTDMNSPLSTVAQLCGYENLFLWMHDEPQLVHDLIDIVTNAFINWVKVQKEHIGEPLDSSNGLQGVWSPKGVGVFVSDDDLVSISPEMYKRYVTKPYSRLLKEFGGGSIHFCGQGDRQAEVVVGIQGVRVVNNSPMGNFDSFERLYRTCSGKVALQIQDCTPLDISSYYAQLFKRIDDPRGIMLASFTLPSLGMNAFGGYERVDWNPFDAANRVVDTIRGCLKNRLAAAP
jgi:hypothetical protein